ncbi:MAG: UDP-N-acetylglucosamine 2-epimerase [Syntrophomonadaceae bacterium]
MSKRKICIVTGTRADYGLLYYLMKEIKEDPELMLQIIATGAHLSPEFGLTYKPIEDDGFKIDEKVEMLLSSDTPVGIAKSMGLATIGFADALDRLKPDIIVLLGDRYEILAAAQAALVARIPTAHIFGGDTTEGAFDEAIRHSITKMSHLHFVSNAVSALRVRQLGEDPRHIFNVGSPGLDYIKRFKMMGKKELEKDLDFTLREINLLITFHPATLDPGEPAAQFLELLRAIDELKREMNLGIVFTRPNADNQGRALNKLLDEYCSSRENTRVFTSLGQVRYLSLIAQVDAVVGNSSSGILEVPSFKKPSVNIGNRQKGRMQSSSVINCPPQTDKIKEAVKSALALDCSNCLNPYGDGESSKRILDTLKSIENYSGLLQKHFFDMEHTDL